MTANLSLYIAPHFDPGAKPANLRAVADGAAIRKWWQDKASPDDLGRVESTLKQLRQDESWLVCGCTEGGNGDWPVLYPFLRLGKIGLRRNFERGQHAVGCCFAFEKVESQPNPEPSGGEAENPVPKAHPSFLEPIETQGLAGGSKGKAKGPQLRRIRVSSLAARLMWLMHASGLQKWPWAQETPAKVLLGIAKQVDIGSGLKLSDILFCNADMWRRARMDGAFRKSREAGCGEQALLICPVVAASRAEGWIKFNRFQDSTKVSGTLEITGLAQGDEADSVRFPMLMCAKVLRDPKGEIRIAAAYLHPCLSEEYWMLVDSNYERQAMTQIVSACEWLGSKGFACTIEKPVYDWGSTKARPDFVVSSKGPSSEHALVVETMGFNTPEYADRKQRTMERLSQYRVYVDLRYRRSADVDRTLWNAVASALRPLRGSSQKA